MFGLSKAKNVERTFLIRITCDPIGPEDAEEGSRNYLEIQPERPSLNVLDVEFQPFLPRKEVAAVDLGETGDSRRHRVPKALARCVAREVFAQKRPRADQTEITPNDAQELGKFVQTRAPEEPPDSRYSFCLRKGLSGGIDRGQHCPKLDHFEESFILPRTNLPKQNWPTHDGPNDNSFNNHEREENDQRHYPNNDVDKPLYPALNRVFLPTFT
jgi:hypothetical protein